MRQAGFYTDGRSAQRQEVQVQAGRTALQLYRPQGERLDEWPYAGLYLAEEVYGDGPVRLRHRGRGEGTLTLPNAELLGRIAAAGGPRLHGRSWLRPTLALGTGAGVLALALLGALLWWAPAALAPLARLVPADWERALGDRVVAGFATDAPFCESEAGTAALAALTARLAGGARLPYPVQVHVVPDGTVNAFATPGGHVLLLEGLLDAAETPEEVAGVLAHELAHAARRHPMQGLIRASGTRLLLGALLGDAGTLDAAASRFAHLLVLVSYTRQDELEADRVAVGLLNAADIRGDGLAAFLRRMEEKNAGAAGAVPALLSTHPARAERIALIEREARGQGAALAPAQWEALRTICE